jgi:hypothetical protein
VGLFDDIVPPDGASSHVATPAGVPRITVRPSFEALRSGLASRDEGVEATQEPEPGNSGGLFDDIVPPARSGAGV